MQWHALLWLPRKLRNLWLWRVRPHIAWFLSLRRALDQATFQWPDTAAEMGPRVVLFVHFDAAGEVRPYVLHYLRALREAGLSVLFVSNSGSLCAGALASLKSCCAGILVRRNVGYDFAALREGLRHFALPRPETELLVLANDSVYGPLGPLAPLLDRIDFAAADFWGATESWQSRYHLQSFFMAAGPALLAHPAWAAFWRQVRPVPDKRWVITRYEVGITQWMLKAGLRCAAAWPYDSLARSVDPDLLQYRDSTERDVVDPMVSMRRRHARRIRSGYARRVALNPTSDMWRQLLQAGFPFLKRELLRDNPTHVSDVTDWRAVVAETSGADVTPIERDLQRLVRNVAP